MYECTSSVQELVRAAGLSATHSYLLTTYSLSCLPACLPPFLPFSLSLCFCLWQVTLYSKGEGYYDTSKSDMAIQLTVNRIRVVALYLFVARILNYVKQLQVPESTVETAKTTSQKSLEEVKSGLLVSSLSHSFPFYINFACP